VNRCRKHSIRSHWRSTISGTVACVSCLSAVPSATAQQPGSAYLMASLSASTTATAAIRTNISVRTDHQQLAEHDLELILMSSRKPTDAEAWERFEAEYSPPQTSPSLVKRQIETVKYGLDTATFALDRFIKNVQSQTDFSLDQGGLRRTRTLFAGELRDNLRVKLDLNLWQGSKPYLGVRIIIPFGK